MANQVEIKFPFLGCGIHPVEKRILAALPTLSEVKVGILHLFLQHTSAALILTENADPDVRKDLEVFTAKLVPEHFPYRHTAEGPEDMPAHIKSALFGASLVLPISHGTLNLGIWQGIYLWEPRSEPTTRTIIATLIVGN